MIKKDKKKKQAVHLDFVLCFSPYFRVSFFHAPFLFFLKEEKKKKESNHSPSACSEVIS